MNIDGNKTAVDNNSRLSNLNDYNNSQVDLFNVGVQKKNNNRNNKSKSDIADSVDLLDSFEVPPLPPTLLPSKTTTNAIGKSTPL